MDNIKAVLDIKGKCQSVIKWRMTDVCNYACSYCLRYAQFAPDRSLNKIEEDSNKIYRAIPSVAKIIRELPGKVKLDLIGGEVSLFDLDKMLRLLFMLSDGKLFRVNITTNMSKPAQFYTNLCELVHSFGAELGITCSFHSEFVSLEKFMEKFQQIKSPTNQKGIRAELVSRIDNQELVERFISYCEENQLSYFVERDLSQPPEIKQKLKVGASKQKSNRYKIITDLDEELLFKTRNEFISGETTDYNSYGVFKGYYCTRDYDFVYLEQDYHVGRLGESNCKFKEPIENFKLLKEPKICPHNCCTLCGHISVSKIKELLMLDKEDQEK